MADKVGFLDGLLHDAAIVYSDKGDYSMVILTDGSSWDAIAEAASTIYDALRRFAPSLVDAESLVDACQADSSVKPRRRCSFSQMDFAGSTLRLRRYHWYCG